MTLREDGQMDRRKIDYRDGLMDSKKTDFGDGLMDCKTIVSVENGSKSLERWSENVAEE